MKVKHFYQDTHRFGGVSRLWWIVQFDNPLSGEQHAIVSNWLTQNCDRDVYHGWGLVAFEDEQDATMFYMAFK